MYKSRVSILMCFFILFSLINTSNVRAEILRDNGIESRASFYKNGNQMFKKNESIRVLIKFKEENENDRIKKDLKLITDKNEKIQQKFKSYLIKENIKFEQKYSFNYLINAISGIIEYENVEKILNYKDIEFVEQIEEQDSEIIKKNKYEVLSNKINDEPDNNKSQKDNTHSAFPENTGVVNPKEAWKLVMMEKVN